MYKMLALNNKRMVIHIGVICQNIYTNENVYILINIKGFFAYQAFLINTEEESAYISF